MLTFAIKKKRIPSIAPKRHTPAVSPMSHSLHLQQAKVRHILRGPTLQPKLTIGAPNDKYEQEADRVADEVMRMPEPRLQRQVEPEEEEEETLQPKPIVSQITPLVQVQRQEEPEEEEEEEPIQTKQTGGQTPQASPSLEAQIQSLKGRGKPLPESDRAFFEPRFGYDLSRVRVHSNFKAAEMARTLNARAFTVGRDIVLGTGQYAPATITGKSLLAHELTHVVQQGHLSGNVLQRFPEGSPAPEAEGMAITGSSSPLPERLRVDVLGADVSVDEPLAIMAARVLGVDIRVMSIEQMIDRLEELASGNRCIGELNIWHHGSPEIQLVIGQYELGPRGSRYRLPESGFSAGWLTLESNQRNLNRLRGVFCCNASMRWMGCALAGIEAQGGVRTREEQERTPYRALRHPTSYQDSEDVLSHGATVQGASFGLVNIQTWANATCTTIRAATDFVRLDPSSPQPIRVLGGGHWMLTSPEEEYPCECNAETGRIGGPAPSRAEIVGMRQRLTSEALREQTLWHHYLRTLRAFLPAVSPPTQTPGWAEPESTGRRPVRRGTLQARVREQVESGRSRREVRQVAGYLRNLLRYASRDITPPAPLPDLSFDDRHRPFINLAREEYRWSGVTFPHLAVCYPNNFWRWTMFNDNAIRDTPEFTRGIIVHELRHAADIKRSFDAYQSEHGPPPPPSANHRERCRPINVGERQNWVDEWGSYVNAFVDFYEQRTPPTRHMEITIRQREEGFERWTASERIDWIATVFRHLPPDVLPEESLAGEQSINSLFSDADRAVQEGIVQEAALIIREVRDYEGPRTSEQARLLRGQARTLLNHFASIIELMIDEEFFGSRSYVQSLVRE